MKKSEPLLLVAAVLFCVVYAWPIIDLELRPGLRDLCFTTQWVIWGIFLVDYLLRLYLAPKRLAFVKANLFDLAIILLPMFRPLRLLRVLVLMSYLGKEAESNFQGQVAWYAASSAFMVVFIGALAELSVEQEVPGAVIVDFPTALWWAITTVTTVGYGDTYPVSLAGRIVAVMLMLYGIGLLGAVTGMLASWLVEKVDAADALRDSLRDEEIAADSRQSIAQLEAEITALRSDIAKLVAHSAQYAGTNGDPSAVHEASSRQDSTTN
ncbi:potassium channel family protein [Arcanobacterium pinnipediorum]|uniref:Potassium channel family protein n=1 Tax=Arcanobacterium pinnipediorum TaxID=1503041 RepID=A0ABY5AH36_9ACTO|nr:potassium channel family protein [Arcanobacterium pinnipediorum]USR79167.1 potassium channel family protein [Arcanobacterium pinnipediorum]